MAKATRLYKEVERVVKDTIEDGVNLHITCQEAAVLADILGCACSNEKYDTVGILTALQNAGFVGEAAAQKIVDSGYFDFVLGFTKSKS